MSTFIRRNKSQLLEYSLVTGPTDLTKPLKFLFDVFTNTVLRIPNRLVDFPSGVMGQKIKAVMISSKKVFALFKEVLPMNCFLAISALIKSEGLIDFRDSTIYILEIPTDSVPSLKASKNTVILSEPVSLFSYNTVTDLLPGFKQKSWDKLPGYPYSFRDTTNQ